MKKKDIKCPKCNSSRVSPIFYNTTPSERKKQNRENNSREKAVTLGYAYSPGQPPLHCNNCGHEW